MNLLLSVLNRLLCNWSTWHLKFHIKKGGRVTVLPTLEHFFFSGFHFENKMKAKSEEEPQIKIVEFDTSKLIYAKVGSPELTQTPCDG